MKSTFSPRDQYPVLPDCEIRELIRRWRAGDREAGDKVILHNEGMVQVMARRYYATKVCGDATFDDLCQWGRIGLERAMQDFDLDGGARFATYAWGWVRNRISRYGKQQGQRVSMSFHANQLRGKVGQIIAYFEQIHHRAPTPEELSELTGAEIGYLKSLRASVVSFEDAMPFHHGSEEDGFTTLADLLPDPSANFEEDVEDRLMLEQVAVQVAKLKDKRLRLLIMRRFGLDGCPPSGFSAVAKKLGVSVERAKQLEALALKKLRKVM